MSKELSIIPIKGIGDISPGSDLGFIIYKAMQTQDIELQQGDVLVVTQKIVSKAEGNVVNLDDVQVSDFARSLAVESNKDASYIEVVLRESRRIVRMDHGVLICETKHGFICANAGVDESNVNGARAITLLPVDPDYSAQQLRTHLQELSGEGSSFRYSSNHFRYLGASLAQWSSQYGNRGVRHGSDCGLSWAIRSLWI